MENPCWWYSSIPQTPQMLVCISGILCPESCLKQPRIGNSSFVAFSPRGAFVVLFAVPRRPGFVPRLDVFPRAEIGGDLFPTPVLLGTIVATGEHEGAGDKDENS
jgi:hypothetical protein